MNIRIAVALPLLIVSTSAITLRFDDADRGPADILHIGGVTVLPIPASLRNGAPGQLSTKAGEGLGVADFGSSGSIDRILHFPAGREFPDHQSNEGLSISVDNGYFLDSMTLRLSAVGEGLPFIEYEVLLLNASNGADPIRRIFTDQPGEVKLGLQFGAFWFDSQKTRFSFINDLRIADEDGDAFSLPGYRYRNGTPEATYVISLSVVALEYSAPVPDSGSLTGIGTASILGLFALTRRQ